MRIVVSLACAAAVLGGCAGEKLLGGTEVAVVERGQLPPPSASDQTPPSRPFLIGVYDTLTLDVYGIEELSNRTARVDGAGNISVPLVGTVAAAGKTPAAVADEIAQGLRLSFVRDPRVAVNLSEIVSQTVTVEGAVRQPGVYPVQGPMTLMRTVARAQGLNDSARSDYIVVFRQVQGRRLAALHDLRAIRTGVYADPEIYANDVVYVGESQARRFFGAALATSGVLAAPLIAVLN